MRRLAPSLTALLLAGCTLAPNYERPAPPVAASWPQGASYAPQPADVASSAADLGWRSFFVDPKVQGLIDIALRENRDLRVAVLNVERARALYRVQRGALLPNLNLNAGASIQSGPSAFVPDAGSVEIRNYTANIGVNAFELDLFGRVRSLSQSALEQYFATDEARRAAQITLLAEVANAYLAWAADLERLRFAQQTLTAQEEGLRLTTRRFEAGAASQLDVQQIRITTERARSDVGQFTTQAAQDENALTLLLGAAVPAELRPQGFPAADSLADLPAGVPSEVLQRRPDILSAERQLRAANADIGVARAAFFPRIALTATAGRSSPSLDNLFDSANKAWSFVPNLTLPLFTGGANVANLQGAKAARDIAVAQYERSIQSGFREVSDALADRGTLEGRLAAQTALAQASRQTLRLSQARYDGGLDSYLQVLTAQQNDYAAQQSLITTQQGRLGNLVRLYQVLGGGWKE